MPSFCLRITYVIILSLVNIILNAKEPKLFSIQALSRSNNGEILVFQKDVEVSNREQALIEHVKNSISKSVKEESKINERILELPGMSSAKVRHLLNNLCTLPNTNYLEIGCWKGSTFISAQFCNQSSVNSSIGIDNWSEFGGPINEFHNNCMQFLPLNSYKFYSASSFSINPNDLIKQPINIYFYDGGHTAIEQELAFTYYNQIFDDVFIAIVDDWSEKPVQDGTMNAFMKLNYEVLFEADLPENNSSESFWWGGLYVAVVRKNG